MSKLSIKDIVKNIKGSIKKDKPKEVVKPEKGVRDMRQEAIDIGAHGAKEMFGGDSNE